MARISWKRVTLEQGYGGHGYQPWVRALRGRAGSYLIRDAATKRLLHTGRARDVYDALTRHFQRWRGATAGPTFDRHKVEVSVAIGAAAPSRALPPGELRFVPDGRGAYRLDWIETPAARSSGAAGSSASSTHEDLSPRSTPASREGAGSLLSGFTAPASTAPRMRRRA